MRAISAERGLNEAWNGLGILKTAKQPGDVWERDTYQNSPVVNSPVTSMGYPCLSTDLVILNAASMFAMASHDMSRANWRPAQILRLNPKVSMGSGTFGFNSPSVVRKRDGLNVSGSGYRSPSWRIALTLLNNAGNVKRY